MAAQRLVGGATLPAAVVAMLMAALEVAVAPAAAVYLMVEARKEAAATEEGLAAQGGGGVNLGSLDLVLWGRGAWDCMSLVCGGLLHSLAGVQPRVGWAWLAAVG